MVRVIESGVKKEGGIKVGSSVLIELDGSRVLNLMIGTYNESNPAMGLVSCDTPIATAILGKKIGETAIYTAAEQKHRVQIIRID